MVVLILVTALLSMTVDAFSRGLRRRLRIETMPTRRSEAPSDGRAGAVGARSGDAVGARRIAWKS